eukprot:SAG31_NODE_6781_length_1891_cov_1.307478_1_plen_147_part_00
MLKCDGMTNQVWTGYKRCHGESNSCTHAANTLFQQNRPTCSSAKRYVQLNTSAQFPWLHLVEGLIHRMGSASVRLYNCCKCKIAVDFTRQAELHKTHENVTGLDVFFDLHDLVHHIFVNRDLLVHNLAHDAQLLDAVADVLQLGGL